MKDIITNWSGGSQLMMDIWAETRTSAKECLMLFNHHCFFESDLYPVCFNSSAPAIMQTFAMRVQSSMWVCKRGFRVVEGARVHLAVMIGMNWRKRKNLWEAHAKFPTAETPRHNLHSVSNRFHDKTTY